MNENELKLRHQAYDRLVGAHCRIQPKDCIVDDEIASSIHEVFRDLKEPRKLLLSCKQ